MDPDPRYDEPFYWWGPGWDSPPSPRIGDLLRDGTIDVRSAAVLWAALARRKSMVVLAGPSGAGKTTLLTALLDLLPPGMRRVYLRGCFETFSFLDDPQIVAAETALLVNEISPHLPVYLWGPAVGRVLDAAQRGFTVLATAHAETVPEFVGALTGSPLRIPAARVAAFEFVAVLGHSERNRGKCHVRGIWRLEATRNGVVFAPMPQPDGLPSDISHEHLHNDHAPGDHWFPVEELIARAHLLEALQRGQIEQLPVLGILAP